MLLPFITNCDLSLATERGREKSVASAQLVQNCGWHFGIKFGARQLCFIDEFPCKRSEGNRPAQCTVTLVAISKSKSTNPARIANRLLRVKSYFSGET